MDPLEKWRTEADQFEERSNAVKRAMRTQQANEARANAVDWETWVRDQLREQKDFLIQVMGGALGEYAEQLRDDLLKKIDAVEQHFKAMKTLYDREIALANSHIKLLQRQLDNCAKREGGDGLATGQRSSPPKYDA